MAIACEVSRVYLRPLARAPPFAFCAFALLALCPDAERNPDRSRRSDVSARKFVAHSVESAPLPKRLCYITSRADAAEEEEEEDGGKTTVEAKREHKDEFAQSASMRIER